MSGVSGVSGVFLSVIVYEQSINQWSVEEQEEHRQHRMDRHSGNKRDRQTDRQTTGVQTTQKQTDKKGLGRDKEGEGGTDRQRDGPSSSP